MMPPQGRDVDGVARLELGGARRGQGLAKARKALEVRILERHHARRLAGHRMVERADIEVGDLVGREQGEAAAAGDDAGDIVRQVEMGADLRAVADPDARTGQLGREAARMRLAASKPGSTSAVGTEPI